VLSPEARYTGAEQNRLGVVDSSSACFFSFNVIGFSGNPSVVIETVEINGVAIGKSPAN